MSTKPLRYLWALPLLILNACGPDGAGPDPGTSGSARPGGSGGPPAASSPHKPGAPPGSGGPVQSGTSMPFSGTKVDPPSPGEASAFATSSNAFGLDLYKELASKPGNVVFSPASISIALAMTYGGARGDTAAQMKQVLHYAGSPAEVATGAGKVASALQDPSQPLVFRIANRLFGEQSVKFEKPWLDETAKAFGAPLEPLDFLKGAPAARGHINDWIAKTTEDRIKELLPANAVDADTRLVLVNALYFLGDWAHPFEKHATRDADFTGASGKTTKVPTMNEGDEAFKFAAKDGVKVLTLPYKGESMSMTFILPDAVDGLSALEKSLTVAKIDDLLAAQKSQQIHVALPKLELQPDTIALRDVLRKLGMSTAFDEKKADFTGMFNPAKVDERIHVGDVFHKAFLKVDEKGTEAAAATAVVMPKAASAPMKVEEFKADHPFLVLLRDEKSGAILFMARVADL